MQTKGIPWTGIKILQKNKQSWRYKRQIYHYYIQLKVTWGYSLTQHYESSLKTSISKLRKSY